MPKPALQASMLLIKVYSRSRLPPSCAVLELVAGSNCHSNSYITQSATSVTLMLPDS